MALSQATGQGLALVLLLSCVLSSNDTHLFASVKGSYSGQRALIWRVSGPSLTVLKTVVSVFQRRPLTDVNRSCLSLYDGECFGQNLLKKLCNSEGAESTISPRNHICIAWKPQLISSLELNVSVVEHKEISQADAKMLSNEASDLKTATNRPYRQVSTSTDVVDDSQNSPVDGHSWFSSPVQSTSVCSGSADVRVHGEEGYFSSPNYAGAYPVRVICVLRLTAPHGKVLRIVFLSFDVEAHDTCDWDSLTLYDGHSRGSNKMGPFCGNATIPPFTTTGRHLVIKFISDHVITKAGFLAKYSIEDAPGTYSMFYHSTSRTDPFLTSKRSFGVGTTAAISATAASANSIPSTASSTSSTPSTASSTSSTPSTASSTSSTPSTASSTSSIPSTASSTSSTPSTASSTSSTPSIASTLSSAATKSRMQTSSAGSVFDICTASSVVFVLTYGSLTSPRYGPGQTYSLNVTCSVLLKASPGKRFQVSFETFDVESHPTCGWDSLAFYEGEADDGPLLRKLCGHELPGDVLSRSSLLFVRFVSDSSVRRSGFKANYRLLGQTGVSSTSESGPATALSGSTAPTVEPPPLEIDVCSGRRVVHVTGAGIFTSPNYGRAYPLSVVCSVLLAAPPGKRFHISFESFDVEPHLLCSWDSVTFFDGNSDNIPPLATLCGKELPNDLLTNKRFLLVKFVSDHSISRSGFKASYTLLGKSDSQIQQEVSTEEINEKGFSHLEFSTPDDFQQNLTLMVGMTTTISTGEESTEKHLTSVPTVETSSEMYQACGRRFYEEPLLRPLVLGGRYVTRKTKWPWMASLFTNGKYLCGATIIEKQWLLTAGHCVDSLVYSSHKLTAFAESVNLQSQNSTNLRFSAIVVHPNHDSIYDADIALLRLHQPLEYSESIQNICIDHPAQPSNIFGSCFVAGWGAISQSGNAIEKLKDAEVMVFKNTQCRTIFPNKYKEFMICAGKMDGSTDSCMGDSGGPLMCVDSHNTWILIGITSWGRGCGNVGLPGIYTNASYYQSWIKSITQDGSNMSCSFDFPSMCGYKDISQRSFFWLWHPSQYLYADSSQGTVDDKAVITMPHIEPNISLCLSFTFMFEAYSDLILSVSFYDGITNASLVLWKISGLVSTQWYQTATRVPPTLSGGVVMFTATRKYYTTAKVRLDDITVNPGICQDFLAFHCNFNSLTTCNYSQLSNDDFDWSVVPGSGPTSNATDYYLAANTNGRRYGAKAKLVSVKMNTSMNKCLYFMYHIHPANTGVLFIRLQADINENVVEKMPFWGRSNGEKWTQGKVSISGASELSKIVIEGRSVNQDGVIAIDNIHLRDGNCL